MKDFITRLQQYSKAWEKFEESVGFEHILISFGHEFRFYEGFLNSFIESEGYYISVYEDVRLYGAIRAFVVEKGEANTLFISELFSDKEIPQAKQSAIEEAFKLIEQKYEN